jgi:hypothetical protein
MFALVMKLKACPDLKGIFPVSPWCPLVVTHVVFFNHMLASFGRLFHPLYPSVRPSFRLSICQSFYSSCSKLEHWAPVKRFDSLQFLNLRQQSVGLTGRGNGPSQVHYLHINTEWTQTNIYASSGIRTHNPSVRAGEDISWLRTCGHCDRFHCNSISNNFVSSFPVRWKSLKLYYGSYAPLCLCQQFRRSTVTSFRSILFDPQVNVYSFIYAVIFTCMNCL